MKKLLVLFVVLAVASSAFAADFSWSWDTDWGWSSDFDENYTSGVDELELGLSVDIDEYNVMALQIEPNDGITVNNPLAYNYFKITTDLGAYLGLSGVGVSWVNGWADPSDAEYSDVLRVGLQNAGMNAIDLQKDWTTDVNLDFGAFWASVAANWNLGTGDETIASYKKEMQFIVGSVDAVPGLSIEAGYLMGETGTFPATLVEEAVFQIDGAYVYAMDDAMSLTVAGSFATDSEATSPASGPGTEQKFGAGLGLDYMVDDMTALNASVEFKGGDDETLRVLGGGVGLGYGDFGVDADFAYALGLSSELDKDLVAADGDMLGVDISGYVKIGMVQFRLGYAVTDFGWANNANGTAGVPTEGGAYMVVTADF